MSPDFFVVVVVVFVCEVTFAADEDFKGSGVHPKIVSQNSFLTHSLAPALKLRC